VAHNPPAKTDRPVWFGGGRLAKDLMLPKHREGWDDSAEANNKATVRGVQNDIGLADISSRVEATSNLRGHRTTELATAQLAA
jgi:hypothetical protein